MISEQILASYRPVSVLAAFCMTIAAASADTMPPTVWQVTKCRVYADTLEKLTSGDIDGLSASFLEENAAFIDRGCVERVRVCPLTRADLEAANILTITAMNAGTASSFLPFDCVGP